MLHSELSFLGDKSVPWDTGCARQLLQISDEERKILDDMPGWSVEAIEKSENAISVGEKSPPVLEEPSTHVQIADTESIRILNSVNFTQVSVLNSDLPAIENSTAVSEKKHSFMQSISLYANKVVNMFSRRRSNSLSDIDRAKFDDGVAYSKSETNLEDDSYSYKTLRNVNEITCKKLDTQILNHPFLKNALPTTKCNSETLVFPLTDGASSREDLLSKIESKRMALLEKRLSLPKENGLLLHATEIRTKNNFGTTEEETKENGFLKGLVPEQNDLLLPAKEINTKISFETTVSKVTTSETNMASIYSVSEVQGLVSQQSVCLPDLVCDNNITNSSDVFDRTNSPSGVRFEEINKFCSEAIKTHKSISSVENVSEVPSSKLGCSATEANSMIVLDEESFPSIASILATKVQEEKIQVIQNKEVLKSNVSKQSCVPQNCEITTAGSVDSQSCGIPLAESSVVQTDKTSLNTPAHQAAGTRSTHRNNCFSETDSENVHTNSSLRNDSAVVNNCTSGRKRKRQSKDNSKPRKKYPAKPPVLIQYTSDEIKYMIQLMKKFQKEM